MLSQTPGSWRQTYYMPAQADRCGEGTPQNFLVKLMCEQENSLSGGRYPALFSPAKGSMQLLMWQHDIVGVVHSVMGLL